MWARLVFGLCSTPLAFLAAGGGSVPIGDFDNREPLAGWTFSSDSNFPGAKGSLKVGPGHNGQGALLEYNFSCAAGIRCGGSVVATFSPPKPLSIKTKGALSLWIRALPEVKITFLVRDKNDETRRYPYEITTLEHSGAEWRQIVVPLAAKSTGYWDEDHEGSPKGRVKSIAIMAEARYPQSMQGTVAFDDVQALDSPDQTFSLLPNAPLRPAPAGAGQLKPRLGVNVHSLADDHALDLARDAGFSFIRADLLWRQVERNGQFRFRFYDRLLDALESRGMGALWILDYGHPQHGGDPPRGAESIAAFARYAEAAAAHFKGKNVRYEIWNEPDTQHFWQPSPNPDEYAALLREAAAAIRRADPTARIATGGLSKFDLSFLARVIVRGGTSDVNAVSVHPYRKAPPETVAAELPPLRQLITRALGEQIEIWDTEWGYASYDYFSKNLRGDGHSAPGYKRQAVLASREALAVWALGLPVAVWYDLHDDGDDPRNPEHNYGLLDAKNADKPAMTAIRTLTRIAADHTYAGMVQDPPDGVHAMRLDGNADRVFVIWNDQPDASVTLQFPTEQLSSSTDLAGQPLKPKTNNPGQAELTLKETAGPIYVKYAGIPSPANANSR